MKTIAELESDLDAAKRWESDVATDRRKAEQEAVNAVRDRFREVTDNACQRTFEADRALKNARVAEASTDPMVGKKVVKIVRKSIGRYARGYIDTPVYGIVEVRTHESVFPENRSWGIPSIGSTFVRLLKKDGTTGSQFDTLNHEWKEVPNVE